MGVLTRLTHTSLSTQVTTDKVFIEKATLRGTGVTTLTLYDGTGTDGRIIAEIACLANDFNSNDNIDESCPSGLHAVLTTGAGIGSAIIYNR